MGHVLRMPPGAVVREALLHLRRVSRDFGQRRGRTGPNDCATYCVGFRIIKFFSLWLRLALRGIFLVHNGSSILVRPLVARNTTFTPFILTLTFQMIIGPYEGGFQQQVFSPHNPFRDLSADR